MTEETPGLWFSYGDYDDSVVFRESVTDEPGEELTSARVAAHLNALEANLATAVSALREYGDHTIQCHDANAIGSTGEPPTGCICGFTATLAALDAGTEPGAQA